MWSINYVKPVSESLFESGQQILRFSICSALFHVKVETLGEKFRELERNKKEAQLCCWTICRNWGTTIFIAWLYIRNIRDFDGRPKVTGLTCLTTRTARLILFAQSSGPDAYVLLSVLKSTTWKSNVSSRTSSRRGSTSKAPSIRSGSVRSAAGSIRSSSLHSEPAQLVWVLK